MTLKKVQHGALQWKETDFFGTLDDEGDLIRMSSSSKKLMTIEWLSFFSSFILSTRKRNHWYKKGPSCSKATSASTQGKILTQVSLSFV